MKITNLKTNHLTTPLGYDYKAPTFSWTVEDTVSKKPVAMQVKIADDKHFTNVIYDSNTRADISSIAFTPDFTPSPATRYHWSITVTGDRGDTATGASWFETPPWGAAFTWVTPEWEDPEIHPYIRKSFSLPGKIKSARAYASGLGAYHLEINGTKVGNEYLTPGYHAYDSWMQYQTYDITDYLNEGENAIGTMLGNAWAKGRLGFEASGNRNIYTSRMAFVCKLVITCQDGSEIILDTDSTWKCAPSPTGLSEIYDGEIYDATKAIPGWSSPGLDDSNWSGVVACNPEVGPLTPRLSPPIKIMHSFKPKEVITTPKGDKVIDIGQIISGWLRFNVNAPKGVKISMYHGEIMQNDEFYNDNLRTAKSEYHYVSDGVPATVEPMFTFHGFRYVKIVGWPGGLNPEDFTACAIYSELEATGSIETSDPFVNRLFQNALWSQRGNFVDVPTDCPQRDERLGWTGDAQVFAGTASFNMDTAAFYHKYMRDMYAEQLKNSGAVPWYVPTNKKENHSGPTCGWADAAAVIPWTVYTHYGDKGLLHSHYPSMKLWCEWLINRGIDVKTGGGWLADFHFGDWLALDGPGGTSPQGGTETAFLAAAYASYSASLTAKAAQVLGHTADAEKYRAFSEQIKSDIREEYFTATGRGALPNQTFFVLCLFMDLVPPQAKPRFINDFVKRLEADNMHLKTGFLGTPLLCRVLSDNGYGDIAYRLFLNDDLPSWLYEVKMGATTIWERWDSVDPCGMVTSVGMNSLNHYAYGSVVEWMYRHMCGLRPAAPGFARAQIRPEINRHFSYAKAEYRSAAGVYRSGWEITHAGGYVIEVTVPFNATADIFLPDAKLGEVVGIEGCVASQDGAGVLVEVDAGCYRMEYVPGI